VVFGNAPTERDFKIFFEGSEARDWSGPADSLTVSHRFSSPDGKILCFLIPLMKTADMRCGTVGALRVDPLQQQRPLL
jgi:hypothetical protein